VRDGKAVIPSGNFTLQEEDKIFVTAPSYNLTVLLKNLGLMTHKVRNVFLAGGSTIGYYLAEALQSYMRVTLIEKDREESLRLAAQLPDVNVIYGDAGSRPLLESEGLASCDALVTLTGRDELNMVISMYGSSYGVPKIVTKMDRVDDAKIIDHLPVGSVISPRKLCCGAIVRYVRALQNKNGAARTIHTIADGQAEAMEFVVDEHTLHCGEPLKQIKLKKNVLIACITRAGKIEIPNGDSCFYRGDSVVIVETRDDVLLQLNDIFEE
jgi:trk system potassium uptake protein TrkA